MSTQVQTRRGNTAQTATFTGSIAELTVDTDKKVVVVHDGVTAGGIPLSKESTASTIFNHANGAFDKANTANVLAQNAYDFANTITSAPAFSHANGAFDFANTTANLVLTFGTTTVLDVSANSSIAYNFSQYANGAGAINNPNVSTFSATTLGFNLNPLSGAHPFHIRLGDNSADFSNGLVHISSTGTLSYDSAAQGKTSGTLLWRIPHTSVGNYKYRCSAHPGAMIGNINIANTANIYFAYSS